MRHLLGGIMVASLLVLVACGDDDGNILQGGTTSEPDTTDADGEGPADTEAYVEALADELQEDQDTVAVDDEAATCLATAMVDLVGADALAAEDITPEDFADADSFEDLNVDLPDDPETTLADGLAECGLGEPVGAALIDGFASEMDEELPPEAAACMEGNIDDQAAATAVATAFVDGSDEGLEAIVSDAVVACPEVMTAVLVAQAPVELTPEDEACIQSVVAAHPDLVSAGVAEEDASASQELGTLVATSCPGALG